VKVSTTGVFKLVAEANTLRVLGVHVVAENGGDVIYAATLTVKFGLTVDSFVKRDNGNSPKNVKEGVILKMLTLFVLEIRVRLKPSLKNFSTLVNTHLFFQR
jgi:hypothetical protein